MQSNELDELDKLLAVLRKHDVLTYKQGDNIIQFSPKMPEFDAPTVSTDVQAGGWKRGADLME